jgi:hypothetical protein
MISVGRALGNAEPNCRGFSEAIALFTCTSVEGGIEKYACPKQLSTVFCFLGLNLFILLPYGSSKALNIENCFQHGAVHSTLN